MGAEGAVPGDSMNFKKVFQILFSLSGWVQTR